MDDKDRLRARVKFLKKQKVASGATSLAANPPAAVPNLPTGKLLTKPFDKSKNGGSSRKTFVFADSTPTCDCARWSDYPTQLGLA